MGPDAMILVFRMFSFKPDIYFSSSTFIKELFSLSLLSGIRMVASAYLRLLILLQQSWFQLMIHQAWNFAWCTLYISYISRITIYSLDIFFLNFEPIHCSMSGSKCCFLACIQVSQEAGNGVWYSHLFKNIKQFIVIHTVRGLNMRIPAKNPRSCLTNSRMSVRPSSLHSGSAGSLKT